MKKLQQLSLFILLAFAAISHAQTTPATVDLDKDRLPEAPLPDHWRFHAGDNPAWANPNFDDSGWPAIRSDRSWENQGYNAPGSIAWYRFQVVAPDSVPRISLMLPEIWTSFEIFADGHRIGSFGKMPPHPVVYDGDFNRFVFTVLPSKEMSSHGVRKIEVAIRVWESPQAIQAKAGGPRRAGGSIGDTALIERSRDLNLADEFKDYASEEIVAALSAAISLASLTLFLLRRRELEYLWFGLKMGLSSVYAVAIGIPLYVSDKPYYFAQEIFNPLDHLLYIAFFLQLFKPRRGQLLKLAVLCNLLTIPGVLIVTFFPVLRHSIWDTIDSLLYLPGTIWIIFILLAETRNKSRADSRWVDARLLLFPILLETVETLIDGLNAVARFYGHSTYRAPWIDYNVQILQSPFPVDVYAVVEIVKMLGFLAIIVLRFVRTQGEQERFATEVEGARSVQQFLIPDDLPEIPGLTIESDYRPAREVGGDFFQVIPNPSDGPALILVGDVAGKGMQAGMLATLLVGSMRTAATFTSDPAIILATLNNRLHGKGAATCLALSIASSGEATLVNAGHLPPYLNGVELPMEGALPLGTIPNLDFPVLHFQISPGDTLTLISDGILEAQRPDGELFGFDRITRQLHQSPSAAHLASAAQNFGTSEQADDITVLTITRDVLPSPPVTPQALTPQAI